MNNNQVAKEKIDFNKSSLDDASAGMITLQDKTNNQISNFLEKTPFLPNEPNTRILDFTAYYD
jgi:hypothetical protein